MRGVEVERKRDRDVENGEAVHEHGAEGEAEKVSTEGEGGVETAVASRHVEEPEADVKAE